MTESGFMTQLTDDQLVQLAFWILRLRNNVKIAKRPIDSKVAFAEYRGALQIIDILGFGKSYAHLNNSVVQIYAEHKEPEAIRQLVKWFHQNQRKLPYSK